MNRFASIAFAVGLATAGTPALADQAIGQLEAQTAKPQPMQMTDAQLDNVAAGLVTVVLVDIVDANGLTVVDDGIRVRALNNSLNDLTIQVPVQAAVGVAAGVLGNAAAVAQTLGRQRTSN
jgi:hypothetical protein